MPIEVTATYNPIYTKQVTQASSDSTAFNVSAASNVFRHLRVNNSAGTQTVYTKIYNVASGSITVGTTDPHLVFKVPSGKTYECIYIGGITFGTANNVATVITGGTGGSTSPTTKPSVTVGI